MMLKELLEDNDLSPPPQAVGDDLLLWVRKAEEELDVRILDDVPMNVEDLGRLRHLAGSLPDDLEWLYSFATPWTLGSTGLETWREHMEIAKRYLYKAAGSRGAPDKDELQKRLENDPFLLPVNLSRNGTMFAFTDAQKRLAIIDGNIGPNLGRPMAIGMRNYLIMLVVADILWCDKGYQTFTESSNDPLSREAGCWPADDPPQHIFVEAYEEGYLRS